jgi:hypothetical protein
MSDTILQSQCAENLECPTASSLLKMNSLIKGDNGDYSKSVLGRLQTIETYLKVTWALIVFVLPLAVALAIKFIH